MRKVLSAIMAFSIILFWGCSTDPNTGTTTVIPLAPTNLTATVISTTQINLSWTDNSTNEAGYKVERKLLGGNFAQVASTGANIATYSDLNLTPNTTYIYRVVAYNSAGNSLQYSNEDTVITTLDTMPSSLNNGLIAYYPFNGNAGDSSGNGNHGTVNGATLTTDRFGNANKAYSFNGNGNLINTSNPFYNADNNHTISIWFNSAINNNSTFFNTNPSPIEAYAISYYLNPTNNFTFALGNGSTWTSPPNSSYFPYAVNLNAWHHFSIVALGNEYKFYFDGNLTYTFNVTVLPSNQLADVYFGGTPVGPGGGYFSGFLDDIRIYNRALNQAEINYLATH